MNKTLLKNFATQARVRLMKDVAYHLGLMGITNKGNAQPTVRQPGMEAYEYAKGEQFKLFGADIEARRRLAEAGLLENGTGEVILTNSLPDESILELSRKLLEE